jgi:hypothetical protein
VLYPSADRRKRLFSDDAHGFALCFLVQKLIQVPNIARQPLGVESVRHPVVSSSATQSPKKVRDPKPWRQAIGLRLRYLRTLHHERPIDLARSLAITTPAVDQWELGKTMPSTVNMIHISKRYGVPLEF